MMDDFRPTRPKKAVARPRLARDYTEPRFRPPDKAAKDELPVVESPVEEVEEVAEPAAVGLPQRLIGKLKRLTARQWATAFMAALLLITSSATAWTWTRRAPPDDDWRPNVGRYEPPPEPTTVASRLTGIQVEPELNELPVTAVMIENSPDARPQSGLREAGVVYEAIAEGGITRFVSLYLESQPGRIGPVRSVRPYYIDFFAPYDAAIAHVGGSPQALAQIRREGIKDLDQFQNPGAYRRDSNRYAPHNMYTSRKQLLQVHKTRGYTKSDFTGFPRKQDEPSESPNARTIDLSISGFLYNPRFTYDAKSNSYKRAMAGRPHVDEPSGKQIAPKVVVAIVSPHGYSGIYSVYKTTGSGKAYIFQDGVVIEGVWEKSGRKSQYKFGDKNGAPVAFNAGQTWLTLVGSSDRVKVTP
jgi:hypothetical protein